MTDLYWKGRIPCFSFNWPIACLFCIDLSPFLIVSISIPDLSCLYLHFWFVSSETWGASDLSCLFPTFPAHSDFIIKSPFLNETKTQGSRSPFILGILYYFKLGWSCNRNLCILYYSCNERRVLRVDSGVPKKAVSCLNLSLGNTWDK